MWNSFALPVTEKKEEPVAETKPKKRYKTHSLAVKTTAPGLSKAEKDAFIEVEARMEQQDRIIRVSRSSFARLLPSFNETKKGNSFCRKRLICVMPLSPTYMI